MHRPKVIIIAFWFATFVNLFGINFSVKFSNFCTMVGLLFPISIIISFGIVWFFLGTAQIHFGLHDVIPNMKDPELWISLTGIMMSFCGIEITMAHAHQVRDPHRNFPRALFIASCILV